MTSEMEGVILRRLERSSDDRGDFLEIMRASNLSARFVQANHSRSRAGTLRGLHFHRRQADLWYFLRGRAQVGLADLRNRQVSSSSLILDGDEPATLFIPSGVAHGFLALTAIELLYLVTTEYDASDEFGVRWDDPTLAIPWEKKDPIISERDRTAPLLNPGELPSFDV